MNCRQKTQRLDMFDIHCHILPGVDDGAQILDDTLKMALAASENRTSAIICTPHYGKYTEYEYKMLPYVTSKLEELLLRHKIKLSLYAGQEILLTDDTVEMLISHELLTLNNSVYPLVEFDFYETPQRALKFLDKLLINKLVPVIAHPERYELISLDIAREFREMGCVLQVNKGSYMGSFGRRAEKYAYLLTDTGLCDVVASDAHGQYKRTTNLSAVHEYISTEWSVEYADLLLKENPFRIMTNRRILRNK